MALDVRSLTGSDERPIGTEGPRRHDFGALWRRGVERFQGSRNEILDAAGLETGDLYLASPDATIAADGRVTDDPYARRLPQRWLLPLHMEQKVADQMPEYMREALRGSDKANTDAQKTESCLRAARSQRLPWVDGVGKSVRAGQFASFMLPSPAAWRRRPSYMDTLSKDIRRDWWRGTDGDPTDDRTQVDRRKSARAYRDALNRHLSGELPFAYRLVSATDCLPFFAPGSGKHRWDLAALLTRTLHDVEPLIADGYTWKSGTSLMIPRGYSPDEHRGAYGQVYLYEYLYYAVDERTGDRTPMLAYSVGGEETWNRRFSPDRDDRAEAVVDLRERFGMQRHLMGYYWGWRRAGEDDPNRMGIPYMLPFIDIIMGTESLISSTEKQARASAFCGWQYVLPPTAVLAPSPALPGATSPAPVPPEMPGVGEAIAVEGKYEPIAPPPLPPYVQYLIELGLAQLQLNTPDPQLAGGPGDASGHKVSLMHALEEVANSHYREGVRLWVEDFGEWVLELACTLIERFKLDGIPFEANLPPSIDPSDRSPRESLLLTPAMVGGRYHVTAYYPDLGSIPDVQQISELYEKRQASWDDLMEARGKTDPIGELVKITAHWLLVNTPQGQQDLLVWVNRYRGDEEKARELIEQGMLTEDGSTADEILPDAMTAAQQAVGQLPGYAQPAPGGTPVGAPAIGGQMAGALEAPSIRADGIAASAIQPPAVEV